MSYIWSIIIIVSIVFSILSGNVIGLNEVILTSSFEALQKFGFIASNMILWSGILEVCISGGTMKYITFLIKPVIKKMFKTKNEEALDLISANIACNVFALGSASTPFAIKAMEKLQEENDDRNKESKDMITLIIINACGFTIIPSSLMALRLNYDAKDNGIVVLLIIVMSLMTTIIMLILNKLVKKWS